MLTLIELPLVLPPAVAGIALFAAFGRAGLLGGTLDAFGISHPVHADGRGLRRHLRLEPVLRAARRWLRSSGVDPALIDASRTLGAGPRRTFFRVALPLAAGGLSRPPPSPSRAGSGEFGATIMFAGSLQGVTQTLPLAIYAQLDLDFDIALALGALLVVVSVAVLLTVKLLPSWTRFTLISLAPSARFDSS